MIGRVNDQSETVVVLDPDTLQNWLPPYMRISRFMSSVWPLSKDALFNAIYDKKIRVVSFKEGTKSKGVIAIDMQSALNYLRSIAVNTMPEKETTPTQELAAPHVTRNIYEPT
jgi:hypothetical protein